MSRENVSQSNFRSILSSAPTVKNTIWDLTKYVLDNLHVLLLPRRDSFADMDTYSQKIKAIYDEDPILKPFDRVSHRRSIVDLYPSDIDEPDFEIRGNTLSRRSSLAPSITSHQHGMSSSMHSQINEIDKLDQMANVAAHHDPVYSYHYHDETDKTVNLSFPNRATAFN